MKKLIILKVAINKINDVFYFHKKLMNIMMK